MVSGLTAGSHVGQHGVDAIFIDQAQSRAGNTQAHPAVLTFHPEAAVLQIGQETALGFVVGIGNMGMVPSNTSYLATFFICIC